MENGSDDGKKKKTVKMSGESLKKMMDKSYGDTEAYNRGRFANEDREQYRFFGRYMSGVGYGSKSHEAFNSYNYHGDTLINGMLRGTKPKRMSQQKEWEDNKERTREYIDQMTEAMDKNPLQKSACVYRGIEKKGTLQKMLGLKLPDGTDIESLYGDKDFMESLVGRTFSDPGFTSTSIDPDFPSRGGFDKACSMEIYCPEGTKGAYFGDALKITDESEYLLQRGTQFVVTGVDVEDKPYNGGKRLKLKVAVIGQEPQEIPELKTLYKPNEKITEAIEKEEELSKKELKSMYRGLSDGALKDIVEARKGPKDKAFYAIDDILMEETFAGNITPEQAGEIEAYAMRIKDIGSRIDPHRSQYGRKLSDGHSEYEPSEKTISKVKKKYPDIPDDLVERIATMRTIAEEHVARGKRDLKRYGEDSIAKRLLESAEEYKKAEAYAIRAYKAAKERASA